MKTLVSLLLLLAPTFAFADKVARSTIVDCAKQPSYQIPDAAGTYTFTGTCTKILVAGASNHLTIESVKELVVAGAQNTIDVGGADTITVSGAMDKVHYKKGLSGAKPKVTISGVNSTVEPTK
ncbi:MAG: DUF3060 domain-containing protein [Kofleriaceae bacterium]